MPRRVLVQSAAKHFDLVEVPAASERHLQEVLKGQPQLIPAEDLGLEGDLLVVGRETALASGYIDLLCLARSGDLVLVEFKTGPQNPDFRHALAQAIDYGSDLWRLTLEDFDRGVVQPYLSSNRVDAEFAEAHNLADAVFRAGWDLSEEEADALYARLSDVLATGDFTFAIAAQKFTSSMVSSLEYLNATMRRSSFFLIEIIQLDGMDLTAHAAQVVARPSRANAPTGTTTAAKADAATLLTSISADSDREALAELISRAETLGYRLDWRSKGVSIRLPTADKSTPLTVVWVFPPGDGWSTARDLTAGVDPWSLATRPSVDALVREYVSQVEGIVGAEPAGGTLTASRFGSGRIANAVPPLLDALESLATKVRAATPANSLASGKQPSVSTSAGSDESPVH